MSSATQEKDSNSTKSVSTFDLEPNPFEQSFASTKKAKLGSNNFRLENGEMLSGIRKDNVEPTAGNIGNTAYNANVILNPQDTTPNGVSENTHLKPIDGIERGKLSSLISGAERPNIHSPPQLTPGGSKRLPPILLSPSFMQQAAPVGSNYNGVPHSQLCGPVSHAGSPPSAGLSSTATTAESLRNGYFLNLPKTGLTPNESNMRTGLTPIVGTVHNIVHHAPPFTTLPSFNNVKPENNINDKKANSQKPMNGQNYNGLGVPNNETVNGTDAVPFTSNLNSILGITNNATNSSTIKAVPDGTHANIPRTSDTYNHNAGPHMRDEQDLRSSMPITTVDPAENGSDQSRRPSNIINSQQMTSRKRKFSASNKSGRSQKRKQSVGGKSPTNVSFENTNQDIGNYTENCDDNEQERKRKEFLERNRVAASKFRKRKKEYIKKVEYDLKFYETEYDDLTKTLDRLCGIEHDSPELSAKDSLVNILEVAIMKNDISSSLSILNHIKKVLHETRYIQRHGKNPRRESIQQESGDEDMRRSDAGSSIKSRSRQASMSSGTRQPINSFENQQSTNSGQTFNPVQNPPSSESNASFDTDTTTVSAISRNDVNTSLLPLASGDQKERTNTPIASAIGTISTLPNIINGTQVIPLSHIADASTNNDKTITGVRQSSLVDLTSSARKAAQEIVKYPNTN